MIKIFKNIVKLKSSGDDIISAIVDSVAAAL